MLKVCLYVTILWSLVVSLAATKKTQTGGDLAVPVASAAAACNAEQRSGMPGSSFIQNAQNATKMVLARQARQSVVTDSKVNASAAIHSGTSNRGASDMITVFFVVAILLFVAVLGFVMVEASLKKKSARESPMSAARGIPGAGRLSEPQLNDRFSTTREPAPRGSVVRKAHQAPRPSVPGTGMSAVRPSASSRSLPGQAGPPPAATVQESLPNPSSLYLCGDDLVVPDLNECNLLIPSIQHGQAGQDGKIEVMVVDTQGTSILRGDVYKAPLYDGTRIELKSREGANTWARCRESGPGRFSLHGRGDSRQPWGSIEMSSGGTIHCQTSDGQKVNFSGQATGKLSVVDSHDILLGVSEVNSRGRSVRVGPLVDVGFVTICHLAIDLLLLESSGRLR